MSAHGGRVSNAALAGLAAAGAAGAAATYALAGAQRFWANWLVWSLYLATLVLGSLFIVALEHLVGARWSVPLRRVPERLAGLVVLAAPAAVVLLLAVPVLYPWARPEALLNPVIAAKSGWLNVPFFAGRVLACVTVWLLSWKVLVGGSLRQDETGDPNFNVRARRFAPVYMVLFGLTITVVAFDWVSSLDPEWYSDIIGVYLFGGAFLTGLAASVLLALYLIDRGRLDGVRFDHLYNLGGFMFAFTVFWSYIAFAQYLLMWYANMPEEVFWYKDRLDGAWLPVLLALAALRFLVPFFALLPRDVKGAMRRLRWVSVLVLMAQFLDLYWLVFPVLGKTPLFSWPELSFALLFVGAGGLWLLRSLRRGADMPVGDPFLKEGLAFRL
jgi:hypothetical protein